MELSLPEFAEELFNPYRYKVLKGGRGSAKSHSVAAVLLVKGRVSRRRILCTREYQNSIADSVHKLLVDKISAFGMQDFYSHTRDCITGKNGTEFIFKGVHHNVDSIKSMEGLTDCWIEEAHTLSKRSWDIIVPTMRAEDSEIYITFNPENETDPVYDYFVNNPPPPRTFLREVNWDQNPWFPQVLKDEKDHQYATNPELAEHIWGGKCRTNSDAQIFKGKYVVQEFSEEGKNWAGPYYGADWGFSIDPTCAVQVFLDMDNLILYLRRETGDVDATPGFKASRNGGVGVELEQIPALFDQIPNIRRSLIRADKSRPETISYVARKGFRIEGAKKWEGSVEDGIEFLRSFRQIVIHPSCKYAKEEFKNYSYKVDRLTGEITTIIVDDWNHRIDAIRYALEPLISKSASVFDSM